METFPLILEFLGGLILLFGFFYLIGRLLKLDKFSVQYQNEKESHSCSNRIHFLFSMILFCMISFSVEAQETKPTSSLIVTDTFVSNKLYKRDLSKGSDFTDCNPTTASYKGEGVYLSADDFIKGKISFENNQLETRYKICLNDFFNSSSIKIIMGDSVIKLGKDSIFGYRDNKNNCYRFYDKIGYKIINPTENILLYSKTSWIGLPKNRHLVTDLFFSKNANASIFTLSKRNLKTVFNKDVVFHELLDVYFQYDDELAAFDLFNNLSRINYIYQISSKLKFISNNIK